MGLLLGPVGHGGGELHSASVQGLGGAEKHRCIDCRPHQPQSQSRAGQRQLEARPAASASETQIQHRAQEGQHPAGGEKRPAPGKGKLRLLPKEEPVQLTMESADSQALQRLRAMDVNAMTPIECMNALFELRKMLD